MENSNIFSSFINTHFKISLLFFALGLFFGLIYSINLLGYSLDSITLLPSNMRSLHISLMLYGFVPLMLSYLPFLLISKEVGCSLQGLHYLKLYTLFWYIFLVFMISSLLFGNTRGLAFYDFPYELNFILALAGIFYAMALYVFIKQYAKNPTWVKVCLGAVIIAPIALLILMNPTIGQVESTVSGPHGDNTLGMSLALIPLYYLIIKLLVNQPFQARWNMLWMIPTLFYFASVLYRTFNEPLTYHQEWFLQYLTLLYLPLLYRWYRDAVIEKFAKKALLISLIAFLFVDVQGNILFIPEIRWLFHRNDLIIAHAHIAMGVGVFFMVISMFVSHIQALKNSHFYQYYLLGIVGIFMVLSLNGFIQAGFLAFDGFYLWVLRSVFGLVTIASLYAFIAFRKSLTHLEAYNVMGVLSDGLGGIVLIFLGSILYPLLGLTFYGQYEYVVFAFVCMTGLIHAFAYFYENHAEILTKITVLIRIFMSSIFFALYYNGTLELVALGICLFDMAFATYYLLFLSQKKETLCQK